PGTGSSMVRTSIRCTRISPPPWGCRRADGGTVKLQASVAGTVLLAVAMLVAVQGCSLSASDEATASPSISATAETATTSEPMSTEPAPPAAPGVNGWEEVGTSVQGRPIRVRTLGHGPRKVLFIGGIHGDEREGAVATL